jgi:hypothetical protein
MTILRLALLSLLLFAVLCGGAEARADQPAPERVTFAVVIGNNKSLGKRRPDLHYADDDAARYFEILQTMAPGRVSLLADFDRDTQRLFPGVMPSAVPPRRRALDAVGQRLAREVRAAQRAGHETEVYFVFAGHGDVAQGEGFIELADARFRSSELKAWLRAIPFTRAHVILDSCNSFFMLGVRKPGGRHFATSEDAARALSTQLPNVGVFLSTSAEGEAFEWSEIQSGIFSHVVRSGLLGAADANADGLVSYVELAAFVATATSNVKNPNMRPHVFARAPGAAEQTPIARLQSMTGVRRFELSDVSSLRLRLRDESGLPLLDAHAERGVTLRVALPESWLRGATLERGQGAASRSDAELYAVPEAPETVTLAALQLLSARSAGRGPDETFRTLFAEPFGPHALASYVAGRRSRPPPVYGVSREDTQRMELVLDQIARAERSRRISESIGGIGFGVLIGGAGVGVLHVDDELSASEKREQRIIGGSLLGLGTLFVIGGVGTIFSPSLGEQAQSEFRLARRSGKDASQAFALADQRIQKMIMERNAERWAQGIFGGLTIAGMTTGFILSEIHAPEGSNHMARRLGWGGGIVLGGMALGDAVLMSTPAETLTNIWRDDPSLNQYQPSLTLSTDGAFLSLSGTL